MLSILVCTAALALGQPQPLPLPPPEAGPEAVAPLPLPQGEIPAVVAPPAESASLPGIEPSLPEEQVAPENAPPDPVQPTVPPQPVEVVAPLFPEPKLATPQAEPASKSAAAADRWLFMKALQGTWYGDLLDSNRMSVWGWTEMSFTPSTAAISNQPVVWNDRANEYLLQQHWVRFERSVVTSGTTDATFGFRIDFLAGSDYRYTLPRGLWNSQELNSNGTQNLYGVDLISHYVEGYFPTVMNGLDIKLGRFFTPFGAESLEAISTPFLSRSYAFNWSPPFTHLGGIATLTINPRWTVQGALVDGNDVWFDPSAEARFVGTAKWTQPGGRNTVTFGTSIGRGKLNSGDPFAPATVSLMTEPAGRNNINVFDIVWTSVLTSRLNYTFETIYGYQTNVPGITNAAGGGTAHWGSIVQYLFYTVTPRLTAQTRLEFFDDFSASRTGFEGLYTAVTGGLVYKLRPDVIFRPELRFDHNNESKPFEGKSSIFTAGCGLILRW